MENVDNMLALEVKREIAERYFGFRKLIEDDSKSYLDTIHSVAHDQLGQIGEELLRIFTLLHRDDLIRQFIRLTRLPDAHRLDSLIKTPSEKEKIFSGQNIRGLTRKGCLHNTFFDAYDRLGAAILRYRDAYRQLVENHATICAQIDLFYRKNDIHSILHFLRGLDDDPALHVCVSCNCQSRIDLEQKMRIHPPPAVSELLLDIPAIPVEKKIRRELKQLVIQACVQQPQLDLRPLKPKIFPL